ncbi:unnamed protein product [Gongylonema pulchrum]|uniref:Peroxidase n=1 Tax=Gongylonema pulchrum TaxID=637853 RepID=A0A183EUU8_9BILA|nr:unnamed protein product [Gongylonema pulchrum]
MIVILTGTLQVHCFDPRAKPVKDLDSPWRNVDGQLYEDFPGEDTIDKLFTHAVKLFADRPALGTRELLEVHEEKQPNGRIFEKWIMDEELNNGQHTGIPD